MHLCKVKASVATYFAILFGFFVLFAFTLPGADAQTPQGLTQFGVTTQDGIESIDLSTLYVKLDIPLLNKQGRGLAFQPYIAHDEGSAASDTLGWQSITQAMTGSASYQLIGHGCAAYDNWVYTDPYNVQHQFPGLSITPCPRATSVPTAPAADGSGLTMTVSQNFTNTVSLSSPNGAIWTVPIAQPGAAAGVGTRQDNNGNDITVNANGITDTLGQPYSLTNGDMVRIITLDAAPASPTTLTYYDPNGSLRTIRVNYGAYYVGNPGLALACGGTYAGAGGPTSLPNSIVLANGTAYTFTYEQLAGSPSGYTTGRIASVTLPTGATLSYTYSGGNGGYLCDHGTSSSQSIASLKRVTPDGTWTYTRTLSGSYGSVPSTMTQTATTTVVDPAGNTTVYTFLYYDNPRFGEGYDWLHTSTSVYQGSASGTPLLLTEICYNGFARPCAAETNSTIPNASTPFTTTDTYTTSGGQTSRSSVTYANTYSYLPTEDDAYDFGATTPTTKTLTQYLTLNSLLTDKVQSVIIEDGNSNILAQTKYGYDETSAASTQGVPQHAAITGLRGNLTSTSVWRNTDGAWLKTTYTNDDTGNRITATDANNNPPTRYIYADSWYSGTSACNVTGTNAFLTEVIDPLGHTSKSAYDSCTGLIRQEQDPNDLAANRSGTITSYDLMGNETSIQHSDGGGTTTSYGGYAVPLTVTTSILATPNPSIVKVYIADTSGRTVREETTSDPGGIIYVDTTYDSLGRLQSTSNPYRSTGDSTYGVTSYGYDALGAC